MELEFVDRKQTIRGKRKQILDERDRKLLERKSRVIKSLSNELKQLLRTGRTRIEGNPEKKSIMKPEAPTKTNRLALFHSHLHCANSSHTGGGSFLLELHMLPRII